MKKILFPTLNFLLNSPFNNIYYTDDGEVGNIALHKNKLARQYNNKYMYSLGRIVAESTGLSSLYTRIRNTFDKNTTMQIGGSFRKCVEVRYADSTFVNVFFHTFVWEGLRKYEKILTKAHEECEVLMALKSEHFIEELFNSANYSTRGFNKLSKESKCDAGGVFALFNKCPDKTFFDKIHLEDELWDWLESNKIIYSK